MKIARGISARRAFTLLEALVVIALVVILLGMFPCHIGNSKAKASRIKCANNLKQTGLAFRAFADAHDDRFPFEPGVLADQGMDRRVWIQMLVLAKELETPRILICPGDVRNRTMATGFSEGPEAGATSLARLQDAAVSYFVGVGARRNVSDSILLGDCNVAAGESAPLYSSRGADPFVMVSTNAVWSARQAHHDQAGNLALGDGSVQQATRSGLQTQLRQAAEAGTNVNRFIFPQ